MTISEIIAEYMVRGGSGDTYAGGMTAGEIEQIKEDSAKLRERVRARRHGAETA
jgi:hypothetical protein